MRARDIRFSRQISNAIQKKNLAKMWYLLSGSYFAYLLPPKSFYLVAFSNLLGLLYTNQSGLQNINVCLGSKKPAISFLSLSSLDF